MRGPEGAQAKELAEMNIKIGQRTIVLGSITTVVALLAVIGVMAAVGIKGWEYSNSNAFCATMCHDVHPEEIAAHKQGAHARVNCVECHMGRNSTLHLMALKPTHFKELWGMIVGYERPLTSGTLRPSREACESCHYPSAEHHDSIAVKVSYGTDAASSESRTKLVLHTGMDGIRPGYTRGIHWHIQNEVRFVSPDPQRREIPWVEVVKPDGTKVVYTDAETKLNAQQIAALPARPMACYDCHNAVGHPFANPAVLPWTRPSAPARSTARCPTPRRARWNWWTSWARSPATTKDREAKVDKLLAEAAAKAATPAEFKPAEQKFNTEMRGILMAASFHEKDFSWKSFPNHTGHADTATAASAATTASTSTTRAKRSACSARCAMPCLR
jgi:hypothetical protein